jgi:uncharacterized membrane protein YkvA (DUF1232 family)
MIYGREPETMVRRSTSAFAGTSALLDSGVRNQLRLAWRLLRDERVSALKFALPALIALYVLSPIDSIPDIFLGPGQIDDLGVITAGVLILARLIPRLAPGHVVDEHLRDMGMTCPAAKPGRDTHGVVEARFNVRS